jgi:hypothetical protein
MDDQDERLEARLGPDGTTVRFAKDHNGDYVWLGYTGVRNKTGHHGRPKMHTEKRTVNVSDLNRKTVNLGALPRDLRPISEKHLHPYFVDFWKRETGLQIPEPTAAPRTPAAATEVTRA